MSDRRIPRIGVVDDDPRLVTLVTRYLQQNGYPESRSYTPEELLGGSVAMVDLLILDIMMPGIDGFELLRRLREQSAVPVIFLSARTEVFDRVVGLELGADDYLTKPFEPRELLARVAAVWRRQSEAMKSETASRKQTATLTKSDMDDAADTGHDEANDAMRVERLGCLVYREFTFDQDRQLVILEGRETSLTSFEFHLLRLLCRNLGLVLTRSQIIRWLETCDFGSYDRSIDVGISRLRKKIESEPGRPVCLKTVWGRGYQLVATPEKPTA